MRSSVPVRIGGAALILLASYVLYALVWLVLCVALNASPQFILAPGFTILAVLPGTGALLARSSLVGGAVGGALPLTVFVLLPMNAPYRGEYSPFTWFVVAAVIGGAFGAVTSGAAVSLAQAKGLPLPRSRIELSQWETVERPRLRRRLLEYTLVVAPVAVLVFVTVLLWQGPPPSAGRSPDYVPSAAERELLASLPAGYGPSACSPAPERIGTTISAAVTCAVGPSGESGAAAYFYRFVNVEVLDADLQASATAAGAAEGDADRCQTGESFQGPWHSGDGTERGLLACFVNNEGANLVWTDRGAIALGWLTRADKDVRALYGYWLGVTFGQTVRPVAAQPPTEAQQRLLAELPHGFSAASCHPAPERESSLIAAAVTCDEPDARGATSAVFLRYKTATALDQAVLERATWWNLPEIDGEKCGTRSQAYGNWSQDGRVMGSLACRREVSGYTMVWSDRDALGLGIVTRADGAAEILAAWWRSSAFTKVRR